MSATLKRLSTALFLIAAAVAAVAQSAPATSGEVQQTSETPAAVVVPSAVRLATETAPAVQQLVDFKDADVKFDLDGLMDTLRDRRHEGWVLAAYPDPKTHRPLIGAGFSLDLPRREHPQRDPLNPHLFLEPSSAELWQAAGLDPERLQSILERYDARRAAWTKKRFRTRMGMLPGEITDDEATQLLRISAIQAIYNAKAYCRDFDRLSASQQMAMSQLVYQMGVNLEEFSQFLGLINRGYEGAFESDKPVDAGYWKTVQLSLMQSQWARLYRTRAVAVIAMLDPKYSDDPTVAEHHVGAVLRPAVAHRRGRHSGGALRSATYTKHRGARSHRSRTRKN